MNGILALHGGLPELSVFGGDQSRSSGEMSNGKGSSGEILLRERRKFLGDWGGRPQFGRPYFERMMDRYQKRILIRSHQPYAPLFMFKKRCVTIFTSYAYVPDRNVAIADMEKEIWTGG